MKELQASIRPIEGAFNITPNDSAFLERKTRGISIGGIQADVDVVLASGERLTITLAPGIIHPLSIVKVWTTNNTATGIIGYY